MKILLITFTFGLYTINSPSLYTLTHNATIHNTQHSIHKAADTTFFIRNSTRAFFHRHSFSSTLDKAILPTLFFVFDSNKAILSTVPIVRHLGVGVEGAT